MIALFGEGFSLGLALGTTCVVTCFPVYLPVMMQEKHSFIKGLKTVFILSFGRFLAYGAIGALAGFLGSVVNSFYNAGYLAAVSYFAIAVYLFYTAVTTARVENHVCGLKSWGRYAKNPFILGVITGISICPPFVAALTRGFNSGGTLGGFLLFSGFFLGTTLYILPLSFISYFTKKKLFRQIGLFATIVMSFWFLFLAVDKVYPIKYRIEFFIENAYIADFSKDNLVLISTVDNEKFNVIVAKKLHISKSLRCDLDKLQTVLGSLKPETEVVLMLNEFPKPELSAFVDKKRLNVVYFVPKTEDDVKKSVDYLKSYALKARHNSGFLYRIPTR